MNDPVIDMLMKVRKNGWFPSTASDKKISEAINALDGWSMEKTVFPYSEKYGNRGIKKMDLGNVNISGVGNEVAIWRDSGNTVEDLEKAREILAALPKLEDAKKLKPNTYYYEIGEIKVKDNPEAYTIAKFSYKETEIKRGHKVTAPDGDTYNTYKHDYEFARWARDKAIVADIESALGLPTVEEEKAEKEYRERDNTNTGFCGACGRNHKLDAGGNIVHHGYSRMGGWNSASCVGTHHEPYEKGTAGTKAALNGVERALVRYRDDLANSGNVIELPYKESVKKENFGGNGWHWASETRMAKKGNSRFDTLFTAYVDNLERTIGYLESDKKFFEERIETWKPELLYDEKVEAGIIKAPK